MDLDLAFVASASSTSKKRPHSTPSCSSSGVKKSLRKNSNKKTIKKLKCKDKKAKDKKKSKHQKSKDHEKVRSKDSKKNKSREKQTEKDKCPKIAKKKLAMMSYADSFMTELLGLSLVDTQPSPLLPGKVRIGSDCSGLGTDAVAVKLSLSGHEDVDVRCAFVSDPCIEGVRSRAFALFEPGRRTPLTSPRHLHSRVYQMFASIARSFSAVMAADSRKTCVATDASKTGPGLTQP